MPQTSNNRGVKIILVHRPHIYFSLISSLSGNKTKIEVQLTSYSLTEHVTKFKKCTGPWLNHLTSVWYDRTWLDDDDDSDPGLN